MTWTVTTEAGRKDFHTALKAYRYAREYVENIDRKALLDPSMDSGDAATITNTAQDDWLSVYWDIRGSRSTLRYSRRRGDTTFMGVLYPCSNELNHTASRDMTISFRNYARVQVLKNSVSQRVGMKTANELRRFIANRAHVTYVEPSRQYALGKIAERLKADYGIPNNHILFSNRSLGLEHLASKNKDDLLFVTTVDGAGSVIYTRIIRPIGSVEHSMMSMDDDQNYETLAAAAFSNKVEYCDGMVDITTRILDWDRFYTTVGEHNIKWTSKCINKQTGQFAIFVEPDMATVLASIL